MILKFVHQREESSKHHFKMLKLRTIRNVIKYMFSVKNNTALYQVLKEQNLYYLTQFEALLANHSLSNIKSFSYFKVIL